MLSESWHLALGEIDQTMSWVTIVDQIEALQGDPMCYILNEYRYENVCGPSGPNSVINESEHELEKAWHIDKLLAKS